ncbi:MAG TPA: glycosyltransferase family A protein [Candidatus Obscuribacterales bacterium]
MQPLVSVCLPVFNGEAFVGAAIESVLAQSYHRLELIVIDDGSADRTAEIVTGYAQRDARIRFYRNQQRLGLFANYNECFGRSAGEFIKPFAQDDLLKPTAVESLLQCFSVDGQISLASGTREWIDESGAAASGAFAHPSAAPIMGASMAHSLDSVLDRALFPLVNFIGEPSAVLFRAEFAGGGFSADYSHLGDFEYWLRIIERGAYSCTDDIVCSIRHHGDRQTVKNFQNLSVAVDVITLSGRLASHLEQVGLSCEHFVSENLIGVATHLNQLVRQGQVDAAAKSNETDNVSPQGLFQIAFQALMLLGEPKVAKVGRCGPSRAIFFNQRRIVRLELLLRKLMTDPGWKLTRIFREVNRLIRLGSQSEQEEVLDYSYLLQLSNARKTSTSFDGILEEQKAYIKVLRTTIGRIKRSRSWALRDSVLAQTATFIRRESETGTLALRQTLSRLPDVVPEIRQRPRACAASLEEVTERMFHHQVSDRMPKVSVLISAEEQSIGSTLLGLSRQTMAREDFEVIVVDSAGRQEFEGDLNAVFNGQHCDMQVRALQCMRGGRAMAHNIALKMARADLIIFLAGDFQPCDGFVEAHWRFHESKKDPNLIGIGAGRFPAQLLQSDFRRWLDYSGSLFGVPFDGECFTLPRQFFYAANSSLRKQALLDCGYFDERFPYDAWDDYEMGLRLFNQGMYSEFVAEAECLHIHAVTLDERAGTMRLSGESACILDALYPGEKGWHALVASSAAKHHQAALQARVRSLISGESRWRAQYYQEKLAACFIEGYRKKLRQIAPSPQLSALTFSPEQAADHCPS